MRSPKLFMAAGIVSCLTIAAATVSASAAQTPLDLLPNDPAVVELDEPDEANEAFETDEIADPDGDALETPQSDPDASAPVSAPEVTPAPRVAAAPKVTSENQIEINTVADLVTAVNASGVGGQLNIALTPAFFEATAVATSAVSVRMPEGAVVIDGEGGTLTSAHTNRLLRISNGGAGSLTFMNMTFDGQEKQAGVDVDTSAGQVTFDGITVKNTASGANGTAMWINPGAALHTTIANSSFVNNTENGYGHSGAGVFSEGLAGSIEIRNSEFRKNRNLVTGSVVGGEGGALFLKYPKANSSLLVVDSLFEENEAVVDGAGGKSSLADGGAVAIFDTVNGAKAVFEGNSFISNRSGDDGGAILIQGVGGAKCDQHIEAGNIMFTNNTFVGNTARGVEGVGDNGGAIQIYANAGGRVPGGGALDFCQLTVAATFTNNTFYNNAVLGSGTSGGAISTSAGGAFNKVILTLNGNIFVDNKASTAKHKNVGMLKGSLTGGSNGNLGLDGGANITYPTAKEVFGVANPALSYADNPLSAGAGKLPIPVLPIFPESTAVDHTTGTLTLDQRDYPRLVNTYDSGAVEIASVIFDVNSPADTTETFQLDPLADDVYDKYYEGTTPTKYYEVSHLLPGTADQVTITTPTSLGAVVPNWEFTGWNTTPNAAGRTAPTPAGEEITVTDRSIYYAQWRFLPGTVSITGNTVVGETLTAVPAGWPDDSEYTYQWLISDTDDADAAVAIAGQTGETLVLTEDMVGKHISVQLTGKHESLEEDGVADTADLVGPVTQAPLPNGTVSITGNTVAGGTLAAVPAGWPTDSDYTYQWVVSDTADMADATDINGATNTTLALTESMSGKYVGVKLVAAHDRLVGGTGNATAITGPVKSAQKPALTPGKVTILGKTETRQTLTASSSQWPSGTTFTYQWMYSDTKNPSDAKPIAGATSAPLKLKAEHMGGWIGLVITGTHPDYGTPASASATMVGPVTPIVTRLGGTDRYDTAGKVHERFSTKTGGILFIATGLTFPDALSVAPVASKLDASLVLTPVAKLAPGAKAAIQRQLPSKVIIVGGTNSVSKNVQKEIEVLMGGSKNVSRIGGADRYETSRDLFTTYFADGSAKTVYVATGVDYPDALAAAPAASFEKGAVVLVRGTKADADLDKAITALKAQKVSTVKISGGPSTVIDPAMAKLKQSFANTTRLYGEDRYGTTADVNKIFPKTTEYVWVASGENFADAFIAAVPAGIQGAPVYLTRQGCVPKETAAAFKALKYAERVISGGSASVSDNAMNLKACP